MPPKGKAKGKPAAKPSAGKKGEAEEEPIPVPDPPPEPVCIPLPEQLVDKYAGDRCLLLTWRDPELHYKLQFRPYVPGTSMEDLRNDPKSEEQWVDAKEKERIGLHNRNHWHVWLVKFEFVRVQYRLKCEKAGQPLEGRYVANWSSHPSDPVACYIDPPAELQAELKVEGDTSPPSVRLTWSSTNYEFLKEAMGEYAQHNEFGPFSSAPGIMMVKMQIRGRAIKVAEGGDNLPSNLAQGDWKVGPIIEITSKDSPFDFKTGQWSTLYREVIHGLVMVFSVRVATSYRWSPWSADSNSVPIVIPAPAPVMPAAVASPTAAATEEEEDAEETQIAKSTSARTSTSPITIKELKDREVVLTWLPFQIPDNLSWVEYRVTACPIEFSGDEPDWDKNGYTAATMILESAPEIVECTLKALHPNAWYVVRVDSRYPFIGARSWGSTKAISEAFQTPFPPRPPHQPIALCDDEVPVAQQPATDAGEGNAPAEVMQGFLWDERPWVALRIEKHHAADYDVLFKQVGAGGVELGGEAFAGWNVPAAIVVLEAENSEWAICRVGFERNVAETIIVRLTHKKALSAISPLQWSACSSPIVPWIGPASFATPAAWARITDQNFGLNLRFFLHPHSPGANEHATPAMIPTQSFATGTNGHRFVSRYQLKITAVGEDTSVTLPAQTLPPACLALAPPGSQSEDPAKVPKGSQGISACLGWHGERFEIMVDPGSAGLAPLLRAARPVDISVRVGNEYKWSPWQSVGAPCQLTWPAPSPIPGSHMKVTALSSTRLKVEWPPFDRAPGVTQLEYIVVAAPAHSGEGDGKVGLEGTAVFERIIVAKHRTRKTDDELIGNIIKTFADKGLPSMEELTEGLKVEKDRERSADSDKMDSWVVAELSGLHPYTQYKISITARYPTAEAFAGDWLEKPELTTVTETPGGDCMPAAPIAFPAEQSTVSISSAARGVLLKVEDRSDYTLEFQAAGPDLTWYRGNQLTQEKEKQFGGYWRGDAGWLEANCVNQGITQDGLRTCWAGLPDFPKKGKDALALPDVVEVRLAVKSRCVAHPCRWIGGCSEPVAVCFAPVRFPPKVGRVLSDADWHLSIQVEIFKNVKPPAIFLKDSENDNYHDSDDENDLMDDTEVMALKKANMIPVVEKETWKGQDVDCLPVGYGHRMVNTVQVRYSLQTATKAHLREQLREKDISNAWQVSAPKTFTDSGSERCSIQVGPSEGLLEGGLYIFQVRVGDGSRWSEWSLSSKAYAFHVPAPQPPALKVLDGNPPVSTEVVSSSVAKVHWHQFRPPPGLTQIEYLLKATPQELSRNRHGPLAVSTTCVQTYQNGWVEHELPNLTPFTPYIFSVQARYLQIGSRDWTEPIESSVSSMETAIAAQDPPSPFAVSEAEPAQNDAAERETEHHAPLHAERYVVLSFPEEEGGAFYDIEYAHGLGNDQDSIALRTDKVSWHNPPDLEILKEEDVAMPKTMQDSVSPQVPNWKVQLPPLSIAQNEPLKIALLQRVQFRLKARFLSETPTTRWWSSLSAPVPTGFAPTEDVSLKLRANGSELGLEVGFTLDLRLQAICTGVDPEDLRAQRAELDTAVAYHAQNPNAAISSAWPSGFGHPFATRYQLRYRRQKDLGSDAWGAWEVNPDVILPEDLIGVQNRSGKESSNRKYSVALLLLGNDQIAVGDRYQAGIRIGDGVKWSTWGNTKDVIIRVPPPSLVKKNDKIIADWMGARCKLTWPPAKAYGTLDSVEYELVAKPHSQVLAPHIVALITKPAAVDTADGQEAVKDVSIELKDLCLDMVYDFVVSARYPTVGPREFTQLMTASKCRRREPGEEGAWIDGAWVAGTWVDGVFAPADESELLARRLQDSEAKLRATPPVPFQVPVPDDCLKRWQGDSFVLASWAGFEPVTDLELLPFEVQYCKGGETDKWNPCPLVSMLTLKNGTPCVALRNLPCYLAQFRLLNPASGKAGAPSLDMVSMYEMVKPAPIVELKVLGTPPKALGLQLQMMLNSPFRTQSLAKNSQVRFRAIGNKGSADWNVLPDLADIVQDSSGAATMLVREEDGLNLDTVYEFSVRVGDAAHMGPWSDSSKPFHFHIPAPVPTMADDKNAGISVTTTHSSADLSWPAFKAESSGLDKWDCLDNLAVEYTVTVFASHLDEPISTFMTKETQVTVHALIPATAYSVKLSARWARFGSSSGEKQHSGGAGKYGLMCAFITSESPTSLVAEITAHMLGDLTHGGQPIHSVKVPIPRPGEAQRSASVDLNLSPYYGGGHVKPGFVRNPTYPPQVAAGYANVDMQQYPDRNPQTASTAPPTAVGSSRTPRKLPSLPAKFAPRDPMDALKSLAFAPERPTGARPVRSRQRHQTGHETLDGTSPPDGKQALV
eukprot:gnl/MRDRNA2_/MRDRNA2_81415_c0_seq1.p1 gnl/MRDRNA2_/MRDRNA2_81415_c0~~gnl/MRDRNA2_/MRDRNA2_81415_c0_seq1.p1  ORF type:complete len:2367 (-),score=491.98 gnl/MRDRNA2_/MRDRNA2_81415_c0_seq1:80-7180(-)